PPSLFFCFTGVCGPRALTSFPTRRSSDLDLELAELLAAEAVLRDHAANRALDGARGVLGEELGVGRGLEPARESGVGVGLLVPRSEEHTSELQSRFDLVCRLLLEKKTQKI